MIKFLYQNNTANDLKNRYYELLQNQSDNEIIKTLKNEFSDSLEDSDDAPIFWIALADLQWSAGRLDPTVKERAWNEIENAKEKGAFLWLSDPLIAKLKHELQSPQPEKQVVRKKAAYRCEWKIGDVYSYLLDREEAKGTPYEGHYLIFQKIGEKPFYPDYIFPVVWVKITRDTALPEINSDVLNELPFVCTSWFPYEDRWWIIDRDATPEEQDRENERMRSLADRKGLLRSYRFALMNKSKRSIPKKLVYHGNLPLFLAPNKEYIARHSVEISVFSWKDFDRVLIERMKLQRIHGDDPLADPKA